MATVLPPINNRAGGGPPQPEYAQAQPSLEATSSQLARYRQVKGNKESELAERRLALRKLQPLLTRQQTAKFRNSYKHTLCLDMLQEGFHLSYQELYTLIARQEDDRLQAGPESLMWTQVMLKDEYEKLDMLKQYLTAAELALRKSDYRLVYQARQELAHYFQSTGDKWLADHFFNTCLSTSVLVLGKTGMKLQAEGHLNVGQSLAEGCHYAAAAEHYESYNTLARTNRDWTMDNGTSYFTDSCRKLCGIYNCIGNQLESEDPHAALTYFTKALDMAKESTDKMLEGEASYYLGLAYDKTGDPKTATELLTNYLESCKEAQNDDGIGRACNALAKAYQCQNKIPQCLTYLLQFVEVAERSGQEAQYSKACHNLGNIYNLLGEYEKAVEHFGKAYNISRITGESGSVQVNRVQYGIAQAHKMLQGFSKHVVRGDATCINRLLNWKSSRTDEFDKPLSDSPAESGYDPAPESEPVPEAVPGSPSPLPSQN